jgi:hypothetical protein
MEFFFIKERRQFGIFRKKEFPKIQDVPYLTVVGRRTAKNMGVLLIYGNNFKNSNTA